MSTSRINFKQRIQRSYFVEILRALVRGAIGFYIDFYSLGAFLHQVINAVYKIPLRKMTRYRNLAIYILEKGTYESLKRCLNEIKDFQSSKDTNFKLLWQFPACKRPSHLFKRDICTLKTTAYGVQEMKHRARVNPKAYSFKNALTSTILLKNRKKYDKPQVHLSYLTKG